VYLLHRHPNAEQIMYVLEGSCLALSEGEPVRLNQGDAMFITQGDWHGVRNDTDQAASTLVIYAGAGTLEEAGYEEPPQPFDQTGKEEYALQRNMSDGGSRRWSSNCAPPGPGNARDGRRFRRRFP
jgi:uncharacterized cupin superfamily protein